MKCPGQDSQYWKADAIFDAKCPQCGASVEFFKDDTTRRCGACGHRFINPQMDFGCAAYCQYAEQCIGDLPPELLAQKEDLLKDRVAVAVKRYLKSDFRRISHVMRLARYAEQIGKREAANMAVILTSAYLHELTTQNAAWEGTVAQLMEKAGARPQLTAAVTAILKGAADPVSLEQQVLCDAVTIAELKARQKSGTAGDDAIQAAMAAKLLTAGGRQEARKVLLGNV